MLALFHNKKCCNCINFVPCILWDFIVLGLVLSWWRLEKFVRRVLAKRTCEEHMTGSWRVVPSCRFHECLASKAFPRGSRETFYLENFWVWLSYPSLILYIPSLPTNVNEVIQREKTLNRFFTTHTTIFFRESYSFLVKIHYSLFSFPFPLSYLERRFVPKHNSHLFRV